MKFDCHYKYNEQKNLALKIFLFSKKKKTFFVLRGLYRGSSLLSPRFSIRAARCARITSSIRAGGKLSQIKGYQLSGKQFVRECRVIVTRPAPPSLLTSWLREIGRLSVGL